jgi:putative endonuclease
LTGHYEAPRYSPVRASPAGRAVSSAVEHLVYTERVGGSKPSPPTSLRKRSAAKAATLEPISGVSGLRPLASAWRASETPTMFYVYILRSLAQPDRHYVGMTQDLRDRLARHNAGEVAHTSKFVPWEISTYIGLRDKDRAFALERYLKSGSGRAFAKKRL